MYKIFLIFAFLISALPVGASVSDGGRQAEGQKSAPRENKNVKRGAVLEEEVEPAPPANTLDSQGNLRIIDTGEISEDPIIDDVDVIAQFPGGDMALFQWIDANIRYPEEAVKYGVAGRVVVKFIVEKDGSVTDPVVIKGTNFQPLDQEALRVIQSMPAWTPASKGGETVRSHFLFPIVFKMPVPE